MNIRVASRPLAVSVMLSFLLTGATSAQSGKVWFKPKTYPESLKLDKGMCIDAGLKQDTQMTTCLIQKGWTLVDQSVFEKDQTQCMDKANQMPQENTRRTFLACMFDQGWDLETDTERELTRLNAEFDDLCKKEEYRPYIEKSPCNARNITLEQLSDTTRINERQKQAMLAFAKATDDIVNRIEDAQKMGGMLSRKMYEYLVSTLKPARDGYRIELVQGKLTWGEYNQRKRDAVAQQAIFVKRASEEVSEFVKTPIQSK
jgi:hypothetical protein